MENEIKTRSIRADNDSFEKFKAISEEFPSQAQALASLISVYEVEKSKAILPERQAEIESFTSYVQKINEIYNHSLLLNHDAEIRIRSEFERQLSSKDEVIQNLQEKMINFGKQAEQAAEQKNKLQQESGADKARISELEKELIVQQEDKIKNDSVIRSLTEITTEYKVYAKENDLLKTEISNLQKQVADIQDIKSNHEKDIRFIAERINLEKNQEILSLKDTYSEKIRELNESYQKRIDELLKQREQELSPKEVRTPKNNKKEVVKGSAGAADNSKIN